MSAAYCVSGNKATVVGPGADLFVPAGTTLNPLGAFVHDLNIAYAEGRKAAQASDPVVERVPSLEEFAEVKEIEIRVCEGLTLKETVEAASALLETNRGWRTFDGPHYTDHVNVGSMPWTWVMKRYGPRTAPAGDEL